MVTPPDEIGISRKFLSQNNTVLCPSTQPADHFGHAHHFGRTNAREDSASRIALNMEPDSRGSQRLAKGGTACQRCRRRKQKCDLKYPNCSNCEGANVVCLTFHSGKQAEVPRNYVSSLEAQVQSLTRENQELLQTQRTGSSSRTSASLPGQHSAELLPSRPSRTRSITQSPTNSDASSTYFLDLVKSIKNVVVEPSRQPRFLGQSGGITLARMVVAAIRVDTLQAPLFTEQPTYDPSSISLASEASLPPYEVADRLIKVYFEYRTPHLPIMTRSEVADVIKNVYAAQRDREATNRSIEIDSFTAYLVFAIALFGVPNPSGGRPLQSEGCFRSAMRWIEKVMTYSKSEVETLRSILLLAQFVALFPARGSLWHLTGIALRICVDIGLHWESEQHVRTLDPSVLQQRRRLWYSTYQLDRMLSITLGRPLGIIDESICVPLPDPHLDGDVSTMTESERFDLHIQEAQNHLIAILKLESEIKHVQHSQAWSSRLAYPKPDYSAWVLDIQTRLQEWHTSIPTLSNPPESSIFACQAYWDAVYHNSIVQLYRPNATNLQTTVQEMTMFFEASCQLIACIKILQRDQKVDILWKTVHSLFMAGLGVVYGLWASRALRTQNPISKSILTLQACASTLSALSESFPGAGGCRDAFESISSATINWLIGSQTQNPPQTTEFEREVVEALGQFQPSYPGVSMEIDNSESDMSTVLLTDAFNEVLNQAAQWPDFQDLYSNDQVLMYNYNW